MQSQIVTNNKYAHQGQKYVSLEQSFELARWQWWNQQLSITSWIMGVTGPMNSLVIYPAKLPAVKQVSNEIQDDEITQVNPPQTVLCLTIQGPYQAGF